MPVMRKLHRWLRSLAFQRLKKPHSNFVVRPANAQISLKQQQNDKPLRCWDGSSSPQLTRCPYIPARGQGRASPHPSLPPDASHPGEPRPPCRTLVVSSSLQNFAKCFFSHKFSRNTPRQCLLFFQSSASISNSLADSMEAEGSPPLNGGAQSCPRTSPL